MTHICASKLTIIGSDNGLSPGLNQCWNIVNWTRGNKLQWISIEIQTFSFKKMHLKMSSGKWRPLCLGLNVLREYYTLTCLTLTNRLVKGTVQCDARLKVRLHWPVPASIILVKSIDFSWRPLPSAFWFNPNQCGPRSPYSVTRPLWLNEMLMQRKTL